MKKRIGAGIICAVMAVSTTMASASHAVLNEYGQELNGYESVATTNFKDVPQDHWAYDEIDRVVAKDWFKGYPDNTFRPNGKITRAEALKVFVQFMGIRPVAVSESSYTDVSPNAWYAPYIEAGKDLFPPLTTYNGEHPFLPDQPVSREDVAYAIVKAKGYESRTTFADQSVLEMFSDKNSISEIIKPYMAVGVSENLISGYPDGTIGAQDPLTRAEFAAMLYRASFAGVQ